MSVTAADIIGITKMVTKEWARQRKAEERGTRDRASREDIYSDRVCLKDVAEAILPAAYQFASGNGKYPVAKRQLYYACREQFRLMTGRALKWNYFSGRLLVNYRNCHPEETENWSLTADPRGTLTIPNADHPVRIPCGTLQIDEHLRAIRQPRDPFAVQARLNTGWHSLEPGQRYQAVVYIEKEGFEPLLREARIGERFDVAIVSNKGQSVVAARKLFDHVCRTDGGVPLLVVHDFDKSGFEIAQRLTTVSDWALESNCVTYEFQNEINVHDLGLRLEDVKHYKLGHEKWPFKGYFAADSICTPEEKAFLRLGRRVELNAFTSPQFVEWLETKLREHLPQRLIPGDDVLAQAYRHAFVAAQINQAIGEARANAVQSARTAPIPTTLRDQVHEKIKDSPRSWDKALYDVAEHHAARAAMEVS